jgi:hypothetical protein
MPVSMPKTDMFTTTMALNTFDRGVRSGGGRFIVQARHPDGHRWLDMRSFATKKDARAAIQHVAQGTGAQTSAGSGMCRQGNTPLARHALAKVTEDRAPATFRLPAPVCANVR